MEARDGACEGAGQPHRLPLLAWEAGEQWPAKQCCLQIISLKLGEELFVPAGADVAPAAPAPPPFQLRFFFPCPPPGALELGWGGQR